MSELECEVAVMVGARRRIRSIFEGRVDLAKAESGSRWQNEIEGAAGELALAKFLDRWHCGHEGKFDGGDVSGVQCRTTTHQDGSLILRQGDRDEETYWLVTGQIPAFVIRGWIRGFEGKRSEFWQAPNGRPGAWFVPIGALKAPSLFY